MMPARARLKVFSDPVHGFISVPKKGILPILETPEVQRLRRIRQLGLGHLVFSGAEHTRFGHALGAMALMSDALQSLIDKGTPVSPEEYEAALLTALLHDIGHGPFSHTLEHQLFQDYHHEQMSRALMCDLNERFGGALQLALEIFDGTYERPFFHQLISSQLDMDRLDYLRRDSFYTGVAEGVIGVERIIKTMRVHPILGDASARLMVERKGQYAVENYLIARRTMYWQVYLHKTVLAGDFLLRAILAYYRQNPTFRISPALGFFLDTSLSGRDLERSEVRTMFCKLDDIDVEYSIKQWMEVQDPILKDLSSRFIHRQFGAVTMLEEAPTEAQVATWKDRVANWLLKTGLANPANLDQIIPFYFLTSHIRVKAYGAWADVIQVVNREDEVTELSKIADNTLIRALSIPETKWYVCMPKEVRID